MIDEIEVDEDIIQILTETDLSNFQTKLVFDKQLTRLEHFQDVTDGELKSYGLSEPAIRRLRTAIDRKKKKRTKIFGGTNRGRTIQLKREVKTGDSFQNGIEFSAQPYLINKREIKLMQILGEGNFSIVKRAQWIRPDGSTVECAVKILNEISEAVRSDLACEISTMQRLRHPNLVQLFGVVFAERIFMVIEFCEGGSLLNRLRAQNQPRPLVTTLLNYSQQVSNGMGYLESRKCLHRDLAARNILLSHGEQIIKICDFGLTRVLNDNEHLYIMHEPKKIPFSWSPPESLRFREFSHKSDVWAFGVTLWEFFTFGEEPWAGYRAAEVLQQIEAGERLRQPEFCSEELYNIMQMCWQKEPEKRPKFSHLRAMLMDVRFMTVVSRVTIPKSENKQLKLCDGDEIILIGQKSHDIWYGQSVATQSFGEFLRTNISLKETTIQPAIKAQSIAEEVRRREISRPITGSFIHTGHGDINEGKCWGHVDHIDEIYLKNPFVSTNSSANGQSIAIVPSVLMLNKKCELISQSSDCQHNESQFNDAMSSLVDLQNCKSDPLPTLNEIRGHSAVIEPISNELPQTRMNSAFNSERSSPINEIVLVPPPPPQQPKKIDGIMESGSFVVKSKYDSSISIPRPKRISSFINENNSTSTTVSPFFSIPKVASLSSLPTVNSTLNVSTTQSAGEALSLTTNNRRPTSTHSLYGEESPSKINLSDDPFMVKDNVKTLTEKLRYNDVHNASQFLSMKQNCAVQPIHSASVLLENHSESFQQQKQFRHSQCELLPQGINIAVVLPFNANPKIDATTAESVNLKDFSRLYSKTANQLADTKAIGPEASTSSLLPPPSDLLLSGFAPKPLSTSLQYQPLFDLSAGRYGVGHQANSCPTSGYPPIYHYETNGIPVLEPKSTFHFEPHQSQQSSIRNPPVNRTISLSELDTDLLLKRVKTNANFASLEQCHQTLLRNCFDVDAAIKQLKIEKLIEMGLATDRDLAASALDSEKWDVNAAANRLCSY